MWIAHDSTRTSQVTWRQASTCPSPPHDASASSLLLARNHVWSVARKLELTLQHMPSVVTSHPTLAHHELRDTSNSHNIVNHSSSKGDHHWSSVYYNYYASTGFPSQVQIFPWHSPMFPHQMMRNWRTHCYLALLRIVTMVLKETISPTQTRVV